jgi:hypothetical protein
MASGWTVRADFSLKSGRLGSGRFSLGHCALTVWAALVAILLTHGAASAVEVPPFEVGSAPNSVLGGVWEGYPQEQAAELEVAPPEAVGSWTVDYRVRQFCDSRTNYEFGTPELPPDGWTPLSRLCFPLDSTWHGLDVGIDRPNWELHLSWMTPMERGIDGDMEDYDWTIPGADFTDLGFTKQHWTDGQMLDLGFNLRLWNDPFGWPVEVWGAGGFRWQRFGLMCYDLAQVKWDDEWLSPPYTEAGDVIAFKQEYAMGYLGGQLRTRLFPTARRPIRVVFQGDWAGVGARNVDHHLLREGDRYTIETTHGSSWHLGLTADVPVTRRLEVGVAVDYLQIHTRGRHRLLNEPLGQDYTWDNGVRVWSDQTWLTAFARVRF